MVLDLVTLGTILGLIATILGIIKGYDFVAEKIFNNRSTKKIVSELPDFMREMRDFKIIAEKELTHNGGSSMKDLSLDTKRMVENHINDANMHHRPGGGDN